MPLMTKEAAKRLSALQLAFMGDTVCDLLTRTNLMFRDIKVKDMHTCATKIVNARAQAAALESVKHLLDEDEADVVRRARNAHLGHNVPHAASREEYLDATGYEALMGYLYLTGQMRRAQLLYELSLIKEKSNA
ncbi:MAG: ribonuclease III [Clostridia bacterium]|nr:ribonuclease III [Clostridia bacterium]